MELKFSRYLSEVSSEITSEIQSHPFSILKAPTGAGKSFAIINKVIPKLPSALFLCPTRTLVDNLSADIPKGYGSQFADENKLQPRIITTYDTGKKLLSGFKKTYSTVFIDEAHLLSGHSDFRKEVLGFLTKLKQQVGVNVVMVTATPETLDLIEGVKLIDCVRQGKTHRREVRLSKTNESAKDVIFNLVTNRNKKNLTIIRHNHKELIDEVATLNPNVNIARLYNDSDSVLQINQSVEAVNSIKKGVIPKEIDVLLTTSIIDAGLSLQVNRDVDIYAVPNDGAGLIHPIDVVQLAARIRDNSKFISNIEVFFKAYGDYELPTGMITTKGNQLVDDLGNKWFQYESLSHSDYTGVLGYYNLIVTEQKGAEIEIDTRDLPPKLRNIQVFKRLSKYPKVWAMLQNEFIRDLGWLDGCLEEGKKGRSEVMALRIANQIVSAYKVLLHPSVFTTEKRYNIKKATLLIDASNELRRKDDTTLKSVLEQILSLFNRANEGDAIAFDRSQYNELDNNAKSIAKEFTKILFTGRLDKQYKLKKRRLNRYEELYLSEF